MPPSKYANRFKPENNFDNDMPMAVYRQPQIVVAEEDNKTDSANTSNFNSANLITTTNANVNKTSLIDKKKMKWQQDKRKFFLLWFML